MFKVYSTADSGNSVRYTVSGSLRDEDFSGLVTDIQSLPREPKTLRIDRVFYSFDKGLRAALHWEDDDQTLIFPLSERGYFSFEDYFGGWSNPQNSGSTGNILLKILGADDSQEEWLFALKLELTKQTR